MPSSSAAARRRDRGRPPGTPWTVGSAAGPRRPDQALRRRDPAAADRRFRHPRSSAGRADHLRAHGRAVGTSGRHADRGRLCRHGGPRDCSTNGCATAPRHTGAIRRDRQIRERSRAMTTASRWCSSTRAGRRSRPTVRARVVIGADGAKSAVAAQCIPGADRVPHVFAYHEIVRAPATGFDGTRCDVYYQGLAVARLLRLGLSARRHRQRRQRLERKGFSLRQAVTRLRTSAGLGDVETCAAKARRSRCSPCGAGMTAGTSCWPATRPGVVAPASGEGIYYAMVGGRLAGRGGERLPRCPAIPARCEPRAGAS